MEASDYTTIPLLLTPVTCHKKKPCRLLSATLTSILENELHTSLRANTRYESLTSPVFLFINFCRFVFVSFSEIEVTRAGPVPVRI